MTLFWFAVVGLLLSVAGFMFWPLVVAQDRYAKATSLAPVNAKNKKDSGKTPDSNIVIPQAALHKQRNIAIFKERLQELEAEKAQGTLDAIAFEQLKIELEKSLLNDVLDATPETATLTPITAKHWFIGALMTLAVAVWSVGIYVALGRSDDYSARLAMQTQGILQDISDEAPTARAPNQPAPDLMKAIALLKEKVQQDPTNISKWFLLANSYAATQQYAKAAETFLEMEKIVPKSSPEYATIKGSYAQALYLINDERMTESVKTAITAALDVDPQEPNALTLKGVEAFEEEAYQQAIGYWEKAKVKANSQLTTKFINPAISAAQAKLGIKPAPMVSKAEPVSTDAVKLQVTVELAPELKAKVSNEQVVFVFARPVGSKMPLAAERLTVKDLPATIVLDDSKSPMPTAKLSSAEIVDITARISLAGTPMPQAGDLFATQEQVQVRQVKQPIKLLINQVVP